MTRPGNDSTRWVTDWIAWNAVKRVVEESGGSQTPEPELDPFGSIDIPTALAIITEASVASAESVRALEKSRRLRRGTFRHALTGAHSLVESAKHLAIAATILADGIPLVDWNAIASSDNLGPLAALVCSQALMGRYSAETSEIPLKQAAVSIGEILGNDISNTARYWLRDLDQLGRALKYSAEESEQVASEVANELKVKETVAAATETYRRMTMLALTSRAPDDDDALIEALEVAETEGRDRAYELGQLAYQRSDLELNILSALWALADGGTACGTVIEKISAIKFDNDSFVWTDLMITQCAFGSSLAHCGTFIGLALVSKNDPTSHVAELEKVQQKGLAACAIASIFLTSAIRQMAEGFEASKAEELLDTYEESWRERYSVVRLLRALV